MAEVTLKLRHDPKTGRRTLMIHFESDADAMAHEHERDHRAFVEALLGVPLAEVADDVQIAREGAGAVAEQAEAEAEGARDTLAEKG